jgi:hypothetical protein
MVETNPHIQSSNFAPKPFHFTQKASTPCNTELTKATTNQHHIEQPMRMFFHDLNSCSLGKSMVK